MRTFPMAWVLPGGHVELNESLEDSVRREVLEETGIRINNSKQLEPFFTFESNSHIAMGTKSPHSNHLIIFFKV